MPPRAWPCTWVHDTDRRGCRRDVLLDTAARGVNLELDDRRRTRRAFCCILPYHSDLPRPVYSGGPGTGSHLGLFVPLAKGLHGDDAQRRRRDTYILFCVAANARRYAAPFYLFELTTTTGPFLARPPAGSPFSLARMMRVHVFTLHHDPGVHQERWQPACFVVHNRTLMRYVDELCLLRQQFDRRWLPEIHGSAVGLN